MLGRSVGCSGRRAGGLRGARRGAFPDGPGRVRDGPLPRAGERPPSPGGGRRARGRGSTGLRQAVPEAGAVTFAAAGTALHGGDDAATRCPCCGRASGTSSSSSSRRARRSYDSRNPRVLKAEITLLEPEGLLAATAGERLRLRARAQNTGDSIWRHKIVGVGGYVMLGAHLYGEDGQPITPNVSRAALPGTWPPARPWSWTSRFPSPSAAAASCSGWTWFRNGWPGSPSSGPPTPVALVVEAYADSRAPTSCARAWSAWSVDRCGRVRGRRCRCRCASPTPVTPSGGTARRVPSERLRWAATSRTPGGRLSPTTSSGLRSRGPRPGRVRGGDVYVCRPAPARPLPAGGRPRGGGRLLVRASRLAHRVAGTGGDGRGAGQPAARAPEGRDRPRRRPAARGGRGGHRPPGGPLSPTRGTPAGSTRRHPPAATCPWGTPQGRDRCPRGPGLPAGAAPERGGPWGERGPHGRRARPVPPGPIPSGARHGRRGHRLVAQRRSPTVEVELHVT